MKPDKVFHVHCLILLLLCCSLLTPVPSPVHFIYKVVVGLRPSRYSTYSHASQDGIHINDKGRFTVHPNKVMPITYCSQYMQSIQCVVVTQLSLSRYVNDLCSPVSSLVSRFMHYCNMDSPNISGMGTAQSSLG